MQILNFVLISICFFAKFNLEHLSGIDIYISHKCSYDEHCIFHSVRFSFLGSRG